MSPELENAIAEIERTIETLRRSSCERWADRLAELLAEVRSDDHYTRKESLFRLGQFCHPKALGDAYVRAPGWQEQVERLHDACVRAFNRLERGAA